MKEMNTEDELLKRLFVEGEVEPSSNLTEKVMHRIDADQKAFEYEPVISKKAWVFMGSIFSMVMIYLMLNSGGHSFQIPEFAQVLKDNLNGLRFDFSFKYNGLSLPNIPSSLLTSLAAINVIGIYLIVIYRWRRWMFR
ncbi:MAG: hypothetical protein ABJG47_20135 [Ekhidna sp.]